MSNKHPPPALSFSSGILDILFLRLWTCEKWWVSLRAHCCACFPTCGLLFLSKPRASSGAGLCLCYLLPSPRLTGKWPAKSGFLCCMLWMDPAESPAGAWCRYLLQDGGSEWVRPSPLAGQSQLLVLMKPQPLLFHIFHLYKRLKNCFQIKQLVTYSDFKKYWKTNIMRRSNLLK